MRKPAAFLVALIGLFGVLGCARSDVDIMMEDMAPRALDTVRVNISFGLDVEAIDWVYEEKIDDDGVVKHYIYYFVVMHNDTRHYTRSMVEKINGSIRETYVAFEDQSAMEADYQATVNRVEAEAEAYQDDDSVQYIYHVGSFEGLEISIIMNN